MAHLRLSFEIPLGTARNILNLDVYSPITELTNHVIIL